MLSLVWKDVAAARRWLLLVIPLGLLHLATFASFGPVFLPAAFAFSVLLAFGSIPLEEIQRTESLWNSLPVTRGQIVMARYLSVLLGILAGLGLSWSVGQVITRMMPAGAGGPSPFVSFHAHALVFVPLALASAAFLPFYFRCGAGRGLILFSAAAVGALLILSVLVQMVLLVKGYSSPIFDPGNWKEAAPELQAKLAAWLEPRLGRILGLFAGLSVCAMALSSLISWRLYETRDL
jgi:hypothetical protein